MKPTARDKYLLAKYGITQDRYIQMLAQGKGACWICKRKPKPGKSLNVDHEHLTKIQKKAGVKFGKVRGLLCFFCNKYLVGRRKAHHAYMFANAAAYLSSTVDWREAGFAVVLNKTIAREFKRHYAGGSCS